MRKILKKIAIISLVFMIFMQNTTLLSDVVFADEKISNSKAYGDEIEIECNDLRSSIIENLDKSENYKITKKDMESLEFLIVRGYCKSLKGLEYAKNLKKLGLSLFNVKDLSPLKNLTKMEELSISGSSEIKTLDSLKNMVNLTFLGISDCYSLTNIDAIGNFTKLAHLSLSSTTKLSSIEPLKNLKNLEVLYLTNSAVKDLSPIKNLQLLRALDISGTELKSLNSLSGANLNNLVVLNIDQSKIPPVLQNNLEDISGIGSLTSLERLIIKYSEVDNISELSNLKNLEYLDLEKNKIKDVSALSNLQELKELILNYNEISSISGISKLKKVSKLNLIKNSIKSIPDLSSMTNLEEMDLSMNSIETIKDLKLPNSMKELRIDDNKIKDFTPLKGINKNTTVYAFEQVVSSGRTKVNYGDSYEFKLPEITDIDGSKVKPSYVLVNDEKVKPVNGIIKLNNIQGYKDIQAGYNLKAKYCSARLWFDISVDFNIPTVSNVKAVSNGYNSNKITWPKLNDVDGYEIYTVNDNIFDYKGRTTSTSYVDKGLKIGKTYNYIVQAYKIIGGEKVYGEFSKPASSSPKLSKTTVKVSSASYNSNKVTWNKVSGASGYEVYRSDSKSGKYSKVKTITSGSTLNYTNTGLTTGTTYYYKVRAYRTVNGKKVYSSYSSIVSAKPTLKTPSVKLTSGSRKATVKWGKVAGASGYEVYRATSKSGKYSKVKTVGSGSTTSYTNSSLTKNKTYYYKVRAYRTVKGKKVYSSYSSAKYIKIK